MAESEWGKLNAGQHYGILALDIDRALACARMGEYEQVVMQYVREHCWGKATKGKGRSKSWPEPKRLRWSLTHIVAETGYPAKRLCEAKRSLIDSGMLVEDGEFVRPGKNAAEWTFPAGHSRAGQKRLSEAALAYATRAQNWRATTADEPDASTDEHSTVAESDSGTAESQFRHTGTAIPAQRNPIPAYRNEIPAQRNGATKEERARDSEDLEIEEIRAEQDATRGCPPVPDEDGAWYVHEGPHAHSPGDAAELFRFAWRLFPDRNLAYGVWEHQRWYGLDVWRAALRKAAKSRPGVERSGYVEAIAADYAANGIPGSAPPTAARRPDAAPAPVIASDRIIEVTRRRRPAGTLGVVGQDGEARGVAS